MKIREFSLLKWMKIDESVPTVGKIIKFRFCYTHHNNFIFISKFLIIKIILRLDRSHLIGMMNDALHVKKRNGFSWTKCHHFNQFLVILQKKKLNDFKLLLSFPKIIKVIFGVWRINEPSGFLPQHHWNYLDKIDSAFWKNRLFFSDYYEKKKNTKNQRF